MSLGDAITQLILHGIDPHQRIVQHGKLQKVEIARPDGDNVLLAFTAAQLAVIKLRFS